MMILVKKLRMSLVADNARETCNYPSFRALRGTSQPSNSFMPANEQGLGPQPG
jgi:hypothetical protein